VDRTPHRIGPWNVERALGAGGMAEAYAAVRRGAGGFEQRVCVKRVLPAFAADPDFLRLFHREARLAASLNHRNVVRVVELGDDAGTPYLALELVEGIDLRRLLACHARLPVAVVALIALELAEALDHAHTRGDPIGPVIHRDLSPANVLVGLNGDVKLTDFGIAKAVREASHARSKQVRGNLWYMAPEQLHRGPGHAEPRSDLFSLGVVLFEALAGSRPHHGATDLAAMMALQEGRRDHLAVVAPHVPDTLAELVEGLLSGDPAMRPASAAAVVERLTAAGVDPGARRTLREYVRDAEVAREVGAAVTFHVELHGSTVRELPTATLSGAAFGALSAPTAAAERTRSVRPPLRPRAPGASSAPSAGGLGFPSGWSPSATPARASAATRTGPVGAVPRRGGRGWTPHRTGPSAWRIPPVRAHEARARWELLALVVLAALCAMAVGAIGGFYALAG
jgi:serine/threonine protein kinase